MGKREQNMKPIHLIIDGQPVETEAGSTILDAAREHHIAIPTLCYSKIIRPQESCRLCVVEVKGQPRLTASCSTPVEEGMVVVTESEEILETRRTMLRLLLREHYGDCVAPCQLTCPAGIDIQGYIALIAQGQYIEALKLIRERLPMPLTIGRVCPHFCELRCNRNLVEEPININHLKRFVADFEMNSGRRNPPPLEELSGQRVAIVGGGPAGLSAAYYLRRLGHGSTIFEAMPLLGGMLRYGIPEYRLPKSVLDWEIEGILGLGEIEARTGVRWGTDFTVQSLKREGYGAFLLATGAWATRKMNIPGEDLEGVFRGVDFLVDTALGKPFAGGRRVAVIGGGNVAMDAARSSLRLGADEVTIVYRRSREEMPASPEEIEGCLHEGIKIRFLAAPMRLLGTGGRVSELVCIGMRLGEPDASGRRHPIPLDGSEQSIPVDTVIAAIGQVSDLTALEADQAVRGLGVTRFGTIEADKETFHTAIDGVFTGGDVYRGPDSVVRAIADGRKVATAIDRYLRENMVQASSKAFNISKGNLETIKPEQFSAVLNAPRERMPELSAEERRTNFKQIELGLTEAAVQREAQRCLSCGCLDVFDCRLRRLSSEFDIESVVRVEPQIPYAEAKRKDIHKFIAVDSNKCVRCKQCYEACTNFQCSDAIDFDETPAINSRCVLCGLCVDVCPTGALCERISGKPGPFAFEPQEAFCPHCGCGCNLVLNLKGDRLLSVSTRESAPPSYGHTCRMGRFDSFEYLRGDRRLQTPLMRKNGELVQATWPEALDRVAKTLMQLRKEYGAAALAGIGSPRATNESNYLLQRIFRASLGTNNLDYPGSRSHLATLSGLGRTLGIGAATNALSEIEQAEVILALGDSIEAVNPIVAATLRRASRTFGRRLIVASSAEARIDQFAAPALRVPPEQRLRLLRTLIHLMIKFNIWDEEFVASRTRGVLELKTEFMGTDPVQEAEQLGISLETLAEVARIVAAARSLAVVYSEDVTVDALGTRIVEAVANLALLTGRIGQVHSGIYPLYRHINVQGALDMGMTPFYYPGHVSLQEAERVERFRAAWSRPLPNEAGLSFRQIIEGAQQGDVKALYVLGEDLTGTDPDGQQLHEPLSRLSFLVVQTSVWSETAGLAHVVLPSTAFLEQEGSMTNAERRVQTLRAALRPPGAALPDWRILADLLAELEPKIFYEDLPSIYREIMAVVPFYAGLTYERLKDGGLQWPCPPEAEKQCGGMLDIESFRKPLEFAVSH
jgi:formate dehydrogenase major subunit